MAGEAPPGAFVTITGVRPEERRDLLFMVVCRSCAPGDAGGDDLLGRLAAAAFPGAYPVESGSA
jgi:hypothetical protein